VLRDSLLMRPSFLNTPAADGPGGTTSLRRRYVAAGAFIGFATGAFARLWMRTLTEDDPVFTIFGTGFILVAFAGFGACAGLALAWRRLRSRRRMAVQRGVGLAPFLFMGPFMPLFLPSLLGSLLAGFPGWRRWLRVLMWAAIGLLAAFFLLISTGRGAVGVASFAMWLPLSYLMFLAQRIVFEPRAAPSPAGPPDPFEPWLGV
jgi:hypothetical protein